MSLSAVASQFEAVNQVEEGWRKRAACTRCRRLKTRCKFDKPESQICTRCEKANTKCETNPVVKKRQFESSEDLISNVDVRNWRRKLKLDFEIQNESHKSHKKACLQKLIQDATRDLASLSDNPNEPLKDIGTSERSNFEWTNEELAAQDPVQMLINRGLLTEQDAEALFHIFNNELMAYIPLSIDTNVKFADSRKRFPLFTLTAIVTTACTGVVANIEELISYLQRVMSERITMKCEFTVELVQSLSIMGMFLRPEFPANGHFPSSMMMIYNAVSIVTILDMGSANDLKMIFDDKHPSAERDAALTRTRVFLLVLGCFAAMSINTNRSNNLRMLPHHDGARTALAANGTLKDKRLVAFVDLMHIGKEALQKISSQTERYSSPDHLRLVMEGYIKQLRDQSISSLPFSELPIPSPQYSTVSENEDAASETLVINNLSVSSVSLNVCESCLQRLLTSEFANASLDVYMTVVKQLTAISHDMIRVFYELSHQHTRFPKFLYLRPLQGLSSLVRVRLLSWTKELDLESELDIDRQFQKVESAWNRLLDKSYTAAYCLPLLQKIKILVKKTKFENAACWKGEIGESAHSLLESVLNKSVWTSGRLDAVNTLMNTASPPKCLPLDSPLVNSEKNIEVDDDNTHKRQKTDNDTATHLQKLPSQTTGPTALMPQLVPTPENASGNKSVSNAPVSMSVPSLELTGFTVANAASVSSIIAGNQFDPVYQDFGGTGMSLGDQSAESGEPISPDSLPELKLGEYNFESLIHGIFEETEGFF